MFLFIMLGANSIVTMVIFLCSIYLSIALIAGDTEYTISKSGVKRKVSTMLQKFTGITKEENFTWKDIEWYTIGSDLNRSMKEYNYLSIKFKGIGNQWNINDSQSNGNNFLEFREAFVKLVEAYNIAEQPIAARAAKPEEPVLKSPSIKRKKSFYETFFAKVFTIATGLFIAALFTFYFLHPEYLKGTHVIRISIVILPGFSYLYYRTFVKKS